MPDENEEHDVLEYIRKLLKSDAQDNPPKHDQSPTPIGKTKRTSDKKPSTIEKGIGKYIDSLVDLRKSYAIMIFRLLCFEIVAMFVLLFAYSAGLIKLEPWIVSVFTESIIAQTFGIVSMVVINLFPKKDFFESLVKLLKIFGSQNSET